MLHNNDPVKLLAVSNELPQLLEVDKEGCVGVDLGAVVPLPAALVQPFTDCVTVYVLAIFIVIAAVVAAVLHNNVPV